MMLFLFWSKNTTRKKKWEVPVVLTWNGRMLREAMPLMTLTSLGISNPNATWRSIKTTSFPSNWGSTSESTSIQLKTRWTSNSAMWNQRLISTLMETTRLRTRPRRRTYLKKVLKGWMKLSFLEKDFRQVLSRRVSLECLRETSSHILPQKMESREIRKRKRAKRSRSEIPWFDINRKPYSSSNYYR